MRGEHNDGNDLFRPTGPQIFSHPVELSPRAGRRHALYEKEGSLKKNRPLPPGMTSRSPRLEPLSYDFRLQPPPWGVETGAAPGESSYNTSYRQPGESSYRAIPTRYQSSPRTKLGTTSTIGGIIFGDDASSQPFPTGNSSDFFSHGSRKALKSFSPGESVKEVRPLPKAAPLLPPSAPALFADMTVAFGELGMTAVDWGAAQRTKGEGLCLLSCRGACWYQHGEAPKRERHKLN